MSEFGDGAEDGKGGACGAGIVGERAAETGPEEATDEVCSHEGRGEWSLEAGDDVMSVAGGRLLGYWILWSAVCLFILTRTDD